MAFHSNKIVRTFSLHSAAQVLANRYTELDCKPEMIALSDEKFFNSLSS